MLSKNPFLTLIKIAQNHPLGFLSLPNTNPDMKNLSVERLLVYKSIPPKISRSLFGIEITYMRILRAQKFELEHEIELGMLRVYTLFLPKMSTLALAPKIAYVAG